jgi:hypothetical protein
LAAFVTIPTIVPDDPLTAGAGETSACATDSTEPVTKPDITRLCKQRLSFMHPFLP